MKTSIKTLIASSLTAIVLSTALITTSVSAMDAKPAKISAPVNVKRVSVKGNVEVLLVQRSTDGVSYADDNTGSATVMQDGDILRITSESKGLTKLVVYVNNIYRIEAADNAVVKTEGKLKTQFLQILLNGNAHAEINTSTESLYTVIKDHADLKLSGSTDNHTLIMDKTPSLTIDKFAALKTNISPTETISAIDKEIALNK
ncbi:GIN domain-containing protein [Pedobacter punctiformis]|uniref:DUF2807 domain-containing protein n=1 Tax=Pedobacter punctiformis TaxID=3004097 RepID=A0ABT4LCT3_9SPHI|nr:DUF2807 domain-containing protein [Pedobacter sp. HCMS5-2]MCZ4245725.1 DUF2807 domain-containing protein [Pedobacter sp. HCMS5-2]